MARDNELRTRLTAEDDASKVIDKVADKVDDLEGTTVEIDVESNIDKALNSLDRLTEEAHSTAVAAEELGRALGPELAAKADLTAVVGELTKLGTEIDEITVNADEFAAKLREAADANVGGGLGQALGTARGETEKLADSARGANSALANMIGNSAQDLGALGGIAGSVGVAFGQMGEYAADAALGGESVVSSLKSMAAVAGPIAALALIMQTVQGVMATHERRAAAAAARTELLGAAMEGAADDSVGLADALRDSNDELAKFDATSIIDNDFVLALNDIAKSIPLIGALAQDLEVDIGAALDAAGKSMHDFSSAITGTTDEAQAFLDSLFAQMQAGKISGDQYRALTQAVVQYREAAAKAATEQARFNVGAEEANAILDELVTKADPLGQMADTWATLFADMADGSIDTQAAADAVNELAEGLGLTQEEVIGLAQEHLDEQFQKATDAARETAAAMSEVQDAFSGTAERVGALGRTFDEFNAKTPLAFADRAADTVASFDELKEALQGVADIGSKPLAPTAVEDLRGLSEESAKVIDSMGGMRDAIQTELSGALESAGGNFDALRDKAGFFRDEVTAQFTAAFQEMGLGPDQVDEKVTELLGNLGLLPSQVETQIRLTQADEAMRKIELFGDAIANLPPEVQAKVAASIDANDPVAAWNLINEGVQAQGAVPIATTADTTGAQGDVEGFIKAPWSTTVDIEGDATPAEREADDFTSERRSTTPVDINASSVLALGIMLAFLTARRTTTVDILANALPAALTIASVIQRRTAFVDIEAGRIDMPTATSLANRIGVVRVPIDLYVRNSPRLDGG